MKNIWCKIIFCLSVEFLPLLGQSQVFEPSVYIWGNSECYDNAEHVFFNETEILLHAYEQARFGSKDFEVQREALLQNRKNKLSSCSSETAGGPVIGYQIPVSGKPSLEQGSAKNQSTNSQNSVRNLASESASQMEKSSRLYFFSIPTISSEKSAIDATAGEELSQGTLEVSDDEDYTYEGERVSVDQ